MQCCAKHSCSGCSVAALSSLVRCAAQHNLANLGMCLTTRHPVDLNGTDAVESADLAVLVDTAGGMLVSEDALLSWEALSVPFTVVNGGLWEPGHGLSRGPCLWTVPSLWWSCRVARHTLQTPVALLTSCDKGQDCDITTQTTSA